jgi:UDPglucose 6-dehydrogenase
MKIAVIGTGYVGLVSGTCFAEMGHSVACIDTDEAKIKMCKAGQSPIYEPGLIELLIRNIKVERLTFHTDYAPVKNARIVFLAVGTPSGDDGRANLAYLNAAAVDAAKAISDDAIIVIKSTVPIGTHKEIEALVKKHTTKRFHIVNNPEFLKEGDAISDFMKPDRVVVGTTNGEVAKVMRELYAPLFHKEDGLIVMSNISAEVTKYACNSFLATKISFINDMANFCDIVGADIAEVRKGMVSDSRIGKAFLYAGIGYGGSCFPKDVKEILHRAHDFGTELPIIEAAEKINKKQKVIMCEKIMKHFNGNISGKTFAFWGAAFKPNTDDIREAPAIDMANVILKAGGRIQFYDPVAGENFEKLFAKHGDKVKRFNRKYECLKGANALILITEWAEFRTPDFDEIKANLLEPVLFDGRNIYTAKQIGSAGFIYYGIGKRV